MLTSQSDDRGASAVGKRHVQPDGNIFLVVFKVPLTVIVIVDNFKRSLKP